MESESAENLFMIQQLNNKLTNQPVQIGSLITAVTNDYHPKDFFPASANGEKECHILIPRRLVDGLIWLPDRLRKERLLEGNWVYDGKIYGSSGLVGMKQIQFFYDGNINRGSETSWRTIEYRLKQHSHSAACDHKYGRVNLILKTSVPSITLFYCRLETKRLIYTLKIYQKHNSE